MQKKNLDIESNFKIREICLEDIDYILKIEQESHPDPWSRKMFENELKLDYSNFFIGNIKSEIVSYIIFWHVIDEAYLTNITVSKDYRKLGIGEKMLNFAIGISKSLEIKKMLLEVRENNLPAILFYKKHGFKETYIRKKYYSNSENAIVMERSL